MSTAVPLSRSASAVSARASTKARLAYIDTIRVLLTVLVVMVHAAVTYGSIGGWFIQDPVTDDLTKGLLSIFVTVCQAFFMGLFFLLSGYFVPGSYDRKSLAQFWKDRLLRLALPFLAFSLILSKFPRYINAIRNGFTGGFLDFFSGHFWDSADAGPTWFLFALLVLSAGYSLWRLARGNAAKPAAPRTAPGRKTLLGFALGMAVLMFAASQFSPIGEFTPAFGFIYLQPAFFPQYILMFIAGILAYRSRWLESLPGTELRFWGWMSLGCAIALPVIFVAGGAAAGQFDAYVSGLHWQSVLLNLWVGLTCTSFSLALILWLRGRGSAPLGPWAQEINASAFAAYLVHPLVLVAFTHSILAVPLHPLAKFGLASLVAVVGSFLLGWLLRQLPGMKRVL